MPLPHRYKVLSLGFPGKLAGSSEPGGSMLSGSNPMIIEALNNGATIEDARVPAKLIAHLTSLYEEGIRVIYNLTSSPNTLTQYLWENIFDSTTYYITHINDLPTSILDNESPSQDQLQAITSDVIERLHNGQNILVHCESGLGRTGTILSAIYMKAAKEYNGREAMKHIRAEYCEQAVESAAQRNSLIAFGLDLPHSE